MTPEFGLSLGDVLPYVVSALTFLGSMYGTRYQLQKGNDDANTKALAALEKTEALEAENRALRAEVADTKIRITRQEVLQEQHAKELEKGVARIEAAVVALHARLDNYLQPRGERMS